MKKFTYFFSISFLFITCSYGQIERSKQLEKSLDSLVSSQFKLTEPGIAILIAKKGQIIYEKAFGSADVELNVAMQPDMVFRIGSITKQFTAIAILQLVEQGKISLNDTLQKFIKDFPSKGYPISIENLLTHTSGIPDYTNADTVNPYAEREDFTPEKIIKYIKHLPLDFKAGTKYNYSNSGYVLLAYIIEKITATNYHKYLQENVIKAADLSNTTYASENVIIPKRVRGYTRDKGFYENCEYQTASLAFGCGDLISTVEDLYKWNNALLAYKLVKKETLVKAFTPFVLNGGIHTRYGYGWFIDSTQGTKCIHHEGQVSGFTAFEDFFPTENVYVSILTNQLSGEDTTVFSSERFRLINDILVLALSKQLQNGILATDSVLNNYIGVYTATFKRNQTLTIYKREGKLYVDLSNGTGKNMVLLALSPTKFILPDIQSVRTTFEFIEENGKVTKLIAIQDKAYEWKKIK